MISHCFCDCDDEAKEEKELKGRCWFMANSAFIFFFFSTFVCFLSKSMTHVAVVQDESAMQLSLHSTTSIIHVMFTN